MRKNQQTIKIGAILAFRKAEKFNFVETKGFLIQKINLTKVRF
jgi:hypothetical protein